jgi:mitotic spindle assembly checkpoint protein MAD1
LERRVADAEQAKRNAEAELAKVKQEKDKVERDRRWFAERERDAEEEREAERAAFERDKVSTVMLPNRSFGNNACNG